MLIAIIYVIRVSSRSPLTSNPFRFSQNIGGWWQVETTRCVRRGKSIRPLKMSEQDTVREMKRKSV